MKKLKVALENRAEKETAYEALVKAAEGRELTELELSQLSTLDAELQVLDKEIEGLQAIEARTKKIAAKEADETEYWLLLCNSSQGYENCEDLIANCISINKILSKIIGSSKSKLM